MTALINDSYVESFGELSGDDFHLPRAGVTANTVHRTHDRDVFVTSVRVVGPSHFEARAELPAAHSFYGPVGDRHDPLLVLETVREAIFAVGHGSYDIPRDTSFIARGKEFEFYPAGLRADGDPVELVIDITATDIKRRRGVMSAARFTAICFRDGEPVGTAAYDASFAPAPVYRRLRGEYKEAKPALAVDVPPVHPSRVGRTDEVDVLLAETDEAWYLRVDPSHPVIFDHVIDHVPGNAAVEAGRQAAYLKIGRPDAVLTSGGMSFIRYIEFDAPCEVVAVQTDAASDGRRRVAVAFLQNGELSAEGVFELLLPPAADA
ncbi:ScbA/BarX family gamma-butyrolactone biosynthesis protein [Actinophytocola sp.]|uniref:ScbA/BarX family gamma-butyrolactone biosynthesis protein n=1 Tax=Actinophytocola sp. TaxID=1872138 RepID=UPI00389A7A67